MGVVSACIVDFSIIVLSFIRALITHLLILTSNDTFGNLVNDVDLLRTTHMWYVHDDK